MSSELIDEKIYFFQSSMLDWSIDHLRDFPWRKTNITNYQIVISEILLQRTKAETVEKIYRKFLKQYPSWKSIASSNLSAIEQALKPIGLYKQRASRLKALATELRERAGRLPKTREELSKLPLMGQYLINSVLLQIYNEYHPLLDVNMARVLERFFYPRKLADIRYDKELQALAYNIANHPESKRINWSIIDFAAIVCKARNPSCRNCTVKAECDFYRTLSNQG